MTADLRRRVTDVDPAAARAAADTLDRARTDAVRARFDAERHVRELADARIRATGTASAVHDAQQALATAEHYAAIATADVSRAEQAITAAAMRVEQTTAARDRAFDALVTVNPEAAQICRCWQRDGQPHPIHYGEPE